MTEQTTHGRILAARPENVQTNVDCIDRAIRAQVQDGNISAVRVLYVKRLKALAATITDPAGQRRLADTIRNLQGVAT